MLCLPLFGRTYCFVFYLPAGTSRTQLFYLAGRVIYLGIRSSHGTFDHVHACYDQPAAKMMVGLGAWVLNLVVDSKKTSFFTATQAFISGLKNEGQMCVTRSASD